LGCGYIIDQAMGVSDRFACRSGQIAFEGKAVIGVVSQPPK
jgi:hypothetical protein